MNWYFEVWGKFAKFNGRASRSEYWFFLLFHIIVSSVLGTIDGLMGSKGVGPLFGLYGLASLIPYIAVSVRRLHDTNRSGWWYLLFLVPILGGLVVLVFFVMDSDAGHNQYGSNPKKVNNVKEDRQTPSTERTASTDSTKEQDWYYSKGTMKNGPIPPKEIIELIKSKKVVKHDLVWTKGMGDWMKVSNTKLKSYIPVEPPPLPKERIEPPKHPQQTVQPPPLPKNVRKKASLDKDASDNEANKYKCLKCLSAFESATNFCNTCGTVEFVVNA